MTNLSQLCLDSNQKKLSTNHHSHKNRTVSNHLPTIIISTQPSPFLSNLSPVYFPPLPINTIPLSSTNPEKNKGPPSPPTIIFIDHRHELGEHRTLELRSLKHAYLPVCLSFRFRLEMSFLSLYMYLEKREGREIVCLRLFSGENVMTL